MVTERTDAEHRESITELLDFAPAREARLRRAGTCASRTSTKARSTTRCSRATCSSRSRRELESDHARGPRSSRRRTRRTSPGENVVNAQGYREEIAILKQEHRGLQEGARPRPRRDGEPRVDRGVPRAERRVHKTLARLRGRPRRERPGHHAGDALLLRGQQARHPVLQLHAEPHERPALAEHAEQDEEPVRRHGRQDGPDARSRRRSRAMFRVRRLHIEGWYSTNFLGNNDGLVLDAPGSNKTKVLSKAARARLDRRLPRSRTTRSTSTTTSRAATRKRPGTTSTSSASPACRCR